MKTLIYIFTLLVVTSQAYGQDSRVSDRLADQLAKDSKETELYFPASVKRFYVKNRFQAAWIKPQDGMGKTWQAMLLLDCVLQFGLAHADYHPSNLSYDTLHTMLEEPDKLGADVKARFDILLTDAMITFMNHLHYGKFNPYYTPETIDRGKDVPFLAVNKLKEALLEKDVGGVLDVQPKSKMYQELQEYLRLVKGQYVGDCYEMPEGDVRLAAINMERLRWAEIDSTPYLQVNIPTYTLHLYEADSVYAFKVIVGKPARPTPALKSAIGHFTTAPDWKVPQKIFVRKLLPMALQRTSYFEENNYTVYDNMGTLVNVNSLRLKEIAKNPSNYSLRQSSGRDGAQGEVVFRFPNSFDIYLHDSPDQRLFKREVRSLSHGSIRVQKAAELAALMLRYDGSLDEIPFMQKNVTKYLQSTFVLKNPLPIKITYITCQAKDGQLLRYKDVYHLDKVLENKLYNVPVRLAGN